MRRTSAAKGGGRPCSGGVAAPLPPPVAPGLEGGRGREPPPLEARLLKLDRFLGRDMDKAALSGMEGMLSLERVREWEWRCWWVPSALALARWALMACSASASTLRDLDTTRLMPAKALRALDLASGLAALSDSPLDVAAIACALPASSSPCVRSVLLVERTSEGEKMGLLDGEQVASEKLSLFGVVGRCEEGPQLPGPTSTGRNVAVTSICNECEAGETQ